MATWTNTTANSASWSNQNSTNEIDAGSPIGMLLCLTYNRTVITGAWANQTANSASWVNVSVN